jgi:hypothetical protein
MATDINAAADALVALAEQFRPIQDIAVVLKSIGSIDQATAERQTAYQQAVAIHEDMKTQIDVATTNLSNLKAQNAVEIVDHQMTVQAMLDEAKTNGDAITAKATSDAAAIIQAANDNATRITDAMNAQIVQSTADLKDLTAQVAQAVTDRDKALADLAAAQAQIAALKQSAASFAGP